MRLWQYTLVILFCSLNLCLAQEKALLIDDFENPIFGGAEGTVDFGAGAGSTVDVTASTEIKYLGNQSLKVTYDAVSGGYMWVARGFDLDAKQTAWKVLPEDIAWNEYNAIAFYVYGSNSQAPVALDIKDSGNEMWRFMFADNFQGWQRITCPFTEFFSRGDWQPNNADKNAELNFPLKSLQFEPRPISKGTLYFDDVELIKQ